MNALVVEATRVQRNLDALMSALAPMNWPSTCCVRPSPTACAWTSWPVTRSTAPGPSRAPSWKNAVGAAHPQHPHPRRRHLPDLHPGRDQTPAPETAVGHPLGRARLQRRTYLRLGLDPVHYRGNSAITAGTPGGETVVRAGDPIFLSPDYRVDTRRSRRVRVEPVRQAGSRSTRPGSASRRWTSPGTPCRRAWPSGPVTAAPSCRCRRSVSP